MILRVDPLQTELPPPSDPDPVGAAAVQELLGGKFGEMSTFMNYTYQSFNFRNRQGARPFYDLLASIAAEEFGHIELVSAAINTMLTGAGDGPRARPAQGRRRNTPALHRRRRRRPRPGLHGQALERGLRLSSGDLIEDLTHNFFLETGARNNKLKVYEMVDHPAARALTGYLLVRGGVHQVAYARALENLTGAQMMKLFPSPGSRRTRSPSASRTSSAASTSSSTASRRRTSRSSRPSSTVRTPRPARPSRSPTRPSPRARRRTTCRRRPRSSPRAPRPRRSRRSPPSCARPPTCPRSPPASWPQRQGQEQRLDQEPQPEQGERALRIASSRGGASDARLPGTRAGLSSPAVSVELRDIAQGLWLWRQPHPAWRAATNGNLRSRRSRSQSRGAGSCSTRSRRRRRRATCGSASRPSAPTRSSSSSPTTCATWTSSCAGTARALRAAAVLARRHPAHRARAVRAGDELPGGLQAHDDGRGTRRRRSTCPSSARSSSPTA